MTKKQMEEIETNLFRLECCFEEVVKEFGQVYAPKLPVSIRTKLIKAAALRWSTEELHRAVQQHFNGEYEHTENVVHMNNMSRMAYMFCVEGFADKIPCIPRIMERRKE